MTVIAHRVEGEGSPLVLLNGIAMTMASWAPIADDLARDYQVIRCDFRGQLMSPGAHRDITEHAGDVVSLLDTLGLASAHIVSTSFGGVIGALLAARYPARTKSLISIASTSAFDRGMAVEIGRWRSACEEVLAGAPGSRLAEILEPAAYSVDYLESHHAERRRSRAAMDVLPKTWFFDLITLMDSTRGFDLEGELHRIRCPTLIAAAELDGFIPEEQCRALAQSITGAEFKVIPRAGHAVVVEAPDRVLSLIRSFLRSA
ncbi:MAG: alpha/beta fold hydrolase [Acidobacteriota bacterium]